MSAGPDTPAKAAKSLAQLERERVKLLQLRDAQAAVFAAVQGAAPVGQVNHLIDAQAEALQALRQAMQTPASPEEVPATEEQARPSREEIRRLRDDIQATARRAQHLCRRTSDWVEGQIHWLVDWAERQHQGSTYGPQPTAARSEGPVSTRLDRSA